MYSSNNYSASGAAVRQGYALNPYTGGSWQNGFQPVPAAPAAMPAIPNLTFLNQQTLDAWREILNNGFIPVYDTNFWMFYNPVNTNTLLRAALDLHMNARVPCVCTGETRLELERLKQTGETPEKRELAAIGLNWYEAFQRQGILNERRPVIERTGNASSYADAALLDLFLTHRLLGDPQKTLCYVGRDKNLASDLVLMNQFKSCKAAGGKAIVKYLNKYGKPVDFQVQPESIDASLRPAAFHALPADAGVRRFGPYADSPRG